MNTFVLPKTPASFNSSSKLVPRWQLVFMDLSEVPFDVSAILQFVRRRKIHLDRTLLAV